MNWKNIHINNNAGQEYSCRDRHNLNKKDLGDGVIMENLGGMAAIVGVCALVLVIGVLGKRAQWLVNFVLRAVMGTVGIYFLNYLLAMQNISLAVGINPVTVLTSGILGFPGIAVLYGIDLFKNL
jgi:inhibitor of the pro-sigma K processing machinery